MSEEETTDIPIERPPSKTSRRLKDVDLDKISQKFLMVLEREVNRLLDESFAGELSENSSKKLVNYMKFLPELRELETATLENLTDEELEKLSKKTTKQGDTDGECS